MKTKKWLMFGLLMIMSVAASIAVQGCGKASTNTTFYGAAS